MRQNGELIFLEPRFKQVLWGGKKLKTDWGYDIPGDNTGEGWVVSAHPDGDCRVRSGKCAGMLLSELWKIRGDLFGRKGDTQFPLLVKMIDAREDLSVQVHPDDTYAMLHENGARGKTECWYVLNCDENSCLIVGHNATSREELERMVREKHWEQLLRKIPVHREDFLVIEPGTVHAIGRGVMLLEIQQSSDITYRLYDYDRLQNGRLRKLHVSQSLEVISVPSAPVENSVYSTAELPVNTMNELVICACYRIFKLTVEGNFSFEQSLDFMIVSVIEGESRLNGYCIKKGDHFIIPSGYGRVNLAGHAVMIISAP